MSVFEEIKTSLHDAINIEFFNRFLIKPFFVMMVGLPGSGKSTVAKRISNVTGAKIFSSDSYREKLLGNENDQSNNQLVFDTLYNDMCHYLSNGESVIFDATNISLKSRHKALDRLPRYLLYQKVAYVVNTSYDLCVINDKERDRSVGEDVIKKFLHQYQCPQHFEGFDEVILHSQYWNRYNEYFEPDAIYLSSEMDKFDQHNPHHIHSVGKHCDLLAEQCDDYIMKAAAYYHDLGKIYTQHFDENGVAHYYNHDNVGAYLLTCTPHVFSTLIEWDEVLEAIFFVNYHMRAHRDFTGAKAERKYRGLFGSKRFDKLMQFAEYDRIASGTYEKEKN